MPRHEELYDVYPDAFAASARLRSAGVRVGIVGNQPSGAEASVAGLVAPGDLVATSAAWGVSKPDPAFFARMLAELGLPADDVAYVGDRVDNDVIPAAGGGMFAVHLRRGPWGIIQAAWPEAARRRRARPISARRSTRSWPRVSADEAIARRTALRRSLTQRCGPSAARDGRPLARGRARARRSRRRHGGSDVVRDRRC